MSNSMVAAVPTDPIGEANMEGMNLPGAGGGWSVLGLSVGGVIGGALYLISWWRKNNISNSDAEAHIDSIKNLQAILAAEREDHAAEVAELRKENAMLRDRADKFAAERNEWMMKFSEISGELRAVKAELESLRAELGRMRGQYANPAN